MIRIFYYSGYRLTVFHWHHNDCVASFAFNPGEEGIEKFTTYLRAAENTPVRILVDLIEEDFNKESIPHVGSRDRKSIIRRLIDRHYRKSGDYFNYNIIGRETTGRKDDIVLYSVLSNPDILQPWLKPMLETSTPVSGIWSLPLLTPKLYKYLSVNTENILVVSQQVPSNLRQTFLKNGKLESSRSAVVNLDDATIGEYIFNEVEQTIRFLSNQRHIGFDDKIEVHVICREQDIPEIQSRCHDTSLRFFKYHKLDEFEHRVGCTSYQSEYCNSLYSFACASIKFPVGHYGSSSLFRHYYNHLASLSLYAASILVVIATLVSSFSFYSKSITLDHEANTLMVQADAINRDYNKNLAPLEDKLKQSQIMQSSVLLTEKIQQTRTISPQNFMSDLSRLLSSSGVHDTNISRLSWRYSQRSSLPDESNDKDIELVNYADETPIQHFATIGGIIDPDNNTLKQSVLKTNQLAESIRKNKRVTDLKIQDLPVDIRPESSIENEIDIKNASSKSGKGNFLIQILMKDRQS